MVQQALPDAKQLADCLAWARTQILVAAKYSGEDHMRRTLRQIAKCIDPKNNPKLRPRQPAEPTKDARS